MHDDRSWNDENRPSWRELDKLKDRGGQRREEKPAFAGTKKQQVYARTMTLKEANKLFTEKKSPDQLKAEAGLAKAKGTPAFSTLAKHFVIEFGITKDWHIHILLASCDDAEIAVPALEALPTSAADLAAGELRNVVSQLKVMAMTGKMKIKTAAKKVLEVLDK